MNYTKNALVIGATSGIGAGIAERLALSGYHVGITGRRVEMLQALESKHSSSFVSFEHDVNSMESTNQCWAFFIERFNNKIDLVVHCAGIGFENPELHWDLEAQTIETNVKGAAYIYNLAYKQFIKQQFGHLVGISSIAGLRGNRGAPAYFASKAFQNNYLESLYFKTKETPGNNIFVTDIRPGFVDTKMALGEGIFWMATVDKACDQIIKAIVARKRRVYISHRWNFIAWVLKVVPSWLQRKVM